MMLSSKRWEVVDDIVNDMLARSKGVRNAERAALAKQAARDVLSTIALTPGIEANAVRKLVAGLAAAITGGE